MNILQNFIVLPFAIFGLIFLVIRLKLPAFFALLLVSTGAGLALGLKPEAVLTAIQDGMGNTLGFIAIVVGLGAMLGVLLEEAGGIEAISTALLRNVGQTNTPWALSIIGFLVAIPVFFDVGLIILMPMIYGLARTSQKSVVYYAIPLAAGLAAAHAFIPPTPGPIAVAELLNADLGWVIMFGAITALPATLIGGPLFATLAFKNTSIGTSITHLPDGENDRKAILTLSAALTSMLIPLILIITATIAKEFAPDSTFTAIAQFTGHPFVALMIALTFLYSRLRLAGTIDNEALTHAMGKALEPAAAVILVTGAGGAFKQVLITSGAGAEIAGTADALSFTPLIFGFIAAAIVRIMQGSATVAMITGAGLTAPLIALSSLSEPQIALIVIAIASGATAFSHVNDSGFWLVSRYLKLSPAETFKTWSASSTLVGLTGFVVALTLSMLF